MPFVKGQSGNPTGRPKGARNKNSELISELEFENTTLSLASRAMVIRAQLLNDPKVKPEVKVRITESVIKEAGEILAKRSKGSDAEGEDKTEDKVTKVSDDDNLLVFPNAK